MTDPCACCERQASDVEARGRSVAAARFGLMRVCAGRLAPAYTLTLSMINQTFSLQLWRAARALGAGLLLAHVVHPPAHAQTPPGRDKARLCVTCHGPVGISTLPNAPNLAGQPEIYLSEQLKNFRSGKRQQEVMSVIAKSLSDDDIRDLAAWYAAIGIETVCPTGLEGCTRAR